MKVQVSIPCYDRKLYVETVASLLTEQRAAVDLGIELEVSFTPGSSLIPAARNQAVKAFFDSACDKMLFLDADVGFEKGAIAQIANHPVDFVGGAYRYKDDDEGYPVSWLDKPELWADPETGLLQVDMVPGGFMCLTRDVFLKLANAFPDQKYEFGGQIFHAFFHCPPGTGEDAAFCRDWQKIGGAVWLDPNLTLTHVDGGKKYTGNIGHWLKNRP